MAYARPVPVAAGRTVCREVQKRVVPPAKDKKDINMRALDQVDIVQTHPNTPKIERTEQRTESNCM